MISKCSNSGLSGTTLLHFKEHEDGTFEARIGIALLGTTNMDDDGFKRCNSNPFHPEFYDNFCAGKGKTKKEALENLKKDQHSIYESLWI